MARLIISTYSLLPAAPLVSLAPVNGLGLCSRSSPAKLLESSGIGPLVDTVDAVLAPAA
jgi:hypothetical protein